MRCSWSAGIQQLDPGTFKNAIDWLTRPPADIARVFKGRGGGSHRCLAGNARHGAVADGVVARLADSRRAAWFEQLLYVGSADKVFDPSGKLIDDAIRVRLRNYVRGFADFVRSSRQGRQ